jgi:putative transcriptional regulator
MNIIGNLLIAPPAVKGNFWYKTVVMITEHHTQGSVGVVINKRSHMSLREFGEQIGIELPIEGFVYLGGPVNVKNLSLLHSNEWASSNTHRINQDFSLSSDEHILPRLSIGDTPKHWRLLLGVCGWSPGQLLAEIKGTEPWNKAQSWCLSSADYDVVFGSDHKDQWCNALDRSGLEFAQTLFS